MDSGKLTGAVFVDLTKAFDTVGHSILLSKLPSFGITGNELEWFTNYLFGRRQQVIVNKVLSDTQFVLCGVPQGSILGPVLFLLYYNDLPSILTKAEILMFADDTVMYYPDKSDVGRRHSNILS